MFTYAEEHIFHMTHMFSYDNIDWPQRLNMCLTCVTQQSVCNLMYDGLAY